MLATAMLITDHLSTIVFNLLIGFTIFIGFKRMEAVTVKSEIGAKIEIINQITGTLLVCIGILCITLLRIL